MVLKNINLDNNSRAVSQTSLLRTGSENWFLKSAMHYTILRMSFSREISVMFCSASPLSNMASVEPDW